MKIDHHAVYCVDTVLDALKGGKNHNSWDWSIVAIPAGLVADLAAPCLVIDTVNCNWTAPKNAANEDSDYPLIPQRGYVYVIDDDHGGSSLYHDGVLVMHIINERGAYTINCHNKMGKLVYTWTGDDTKWEKR
jgi:hypothetical protein